MYTPHHDHLALALVVPRDSTGVIESRQKSSSSDVGMAIILVCDTLEVLGSLVLLAILLIAWRSKRVCRSSTWFLFIISCLLSSVSTLLIFGKQDAKQPGWNLCLAQAALVYSTALFTALSGAAFVLQIYLAMMSVESPSRIASALISFTLYGVPLLVSLGICIMSLCIALFNPSVVTRDTFGIRCHLDNPLVYRITAALGISGIAAVLIPQGLIAYKLCRSRKTYQQRLDHSRTPFTVVIRVFVFTILGVIFLTIGLLTYLPVQKNATTYSLYNIIIAALPLAAGLVFGTQKDIINVWLFWRPAQSTVRSALIQSEPGFSDVTIGRTQ